MSGADLSLTEWVVLSLIAERASHGFAIARELRPEADLGRILTVHRPLVYRALDRLVDAGLAEPQHTEPGDGGPNRVVHRPTRKGRAALRRWFAQPVAHVRDLRIEFLAKLRLTERSGADPRALVLTQHRVLSATLDRLIEDDDVGQGDIVDLWRRHSAAAARSFLAQVAAQEPA